MKHEENNLFSEQRLLTFGAFSCTMWKNDAVFHGNEENYIFSIFPVFKTFRPKQFKKDYQYLWHTSHTHNVSKIGDVFTKISLYSKNINLYFKV